MLNNQINKQKAHGNYENLLLNNILNYKMKHKRGRECYIFVRAFRRNGPVWQHGIRTPRSSHCQTNSCPF